jgi:hypothetical protein
VSEVVFANEAAPHIRTEPAMRLPRRVTGSPIVLETLDSHLLVGSERDDKDGALGDYADGCENHFLLADAYSGLAEQEQGKRIFTGALTKELMKQISYGGNVTSRGFGKV